MFSQFRNVVEHLAQETTRALENASLPEGQTEAHSRSQSLEAAVQRSASIPSSSQLADSALSSLRKSLVSQRAGTSSSTTRRSGSPAPVEKRLPKSNLEERLRRATTGIAEPSGSSTPNRSPPNRSSTASPLPISRNTVNPHKESPSIPLPASPAVVAATEDDSKLAPPTALSLQELPITSNVQPPKEAKEEETNGVPDPRPLIENPISVPVEATQDNPLKDKEDGVRAVDVDISKPPSLADDSAVVSEAESLKDKDDQVVDGGDNSVDISSSPIDVQLVDQVEEYPTEDIPESHHIPPVEEAIEIPSKPKPSDEVKMGETPISPPNTVPAVDHSAEVEQLQERLRQVEQRFSGMLH